MPIVEKYFGKLPARPKPIDIATEEPKQIAERRIALKEMSQPIYAEGYLRPNYKHADDAVYDVIADLLSSGRTSRLYRSLVRDKKLAMGVEGGSGFPGNKYTNLFYFFGMPMPGHSLDELANGIHAEVDRLKNEDITDDELKAVKTRVKVGLLSALGSNSGLAAALATVQTRYGDWRELFRSVEKLDKVTKADVRRVANSTFVPTNRTVAVIENAKSAKGAK
jgi:predicted Zn-dependent peptidase